MRTSLWSTIVGAALAASIAPPDAHAADVRTSIGIPRVTFSGGSSSLTRDLGVMIDGDLFTVVASTPFCAQSSNVASIAQAGPSSACAPGSANAAGSLGEHSAGITLKLPQWQPGMPYVDVSLRSSRGESTRDGSRLAALGLAAEAEIGHSFGPLDFNAGYSHPLATTDSWRVSWVGAGTRIAGDAMLHLTYESAHDSVSGARDHRYAMRLTRVVGDAMRVTAFLTHAPDDSERRWQAGVGVDWTF